MEEERPAKEGTGKAVTARVASEGFTDAERAAMKERCPGGEGRSPPRQARGEGGERGRQDRRDARRGSRDGGADPRDHHDHRTGPLARTWYGVPAYAKGGKVVCFFQSADKFGSRYATLGSNDTAHLDDGATWPTAFAPKELAAAEEERITELLKKAVAEG